VARGSQRVTEPDAWTCHGEHVCASSTCLAGIPTAVASWDRSARDEGQCRVNRLE
jgi:hypothetical protein